MGIYYMEVFIILKLCTFQMNSWHNLFSVSRELESTQCKPKCPLRRERFINSLTSVITCQVTRLWLPQKETSSQRYYAAKETSNHESKQCFSYLLHSSDKIAVFI